MLCGFTLGNNSLRCSKPCYNQSPSVLSSFRSPSKPMCHATFHFRFAIAVCLFFPLQNLNAETGRVNFSRDIRPILSDKCFQCHGSDEAKQQSGLRLDVHDDAIAPADTGAMAIVPKQPEASELIQRILSQDADIVMPPAVSPKKLTEGEINLLRKWIAEDETSKYGNLRNYQHVKNEACSVGRYIRPPGKPSHDDGKKSSRPEMLSLGCKKTDIDMVFRSDLLFRAQTRGLLSNADRFTAEERNATLIFRTILNMRADRN